MNANTMKGSVHFKCAWDINCVGCYTDTIQTAFEFSGDGRGLITNHEVFVNANFYQSATYGAAEVIKVSCETKGNPVIFNSCRFDRNDQEAVISTTETKLGRVMFKNSINNFTAGSIVIGDFKAISGATAGQHGTLWSNKVYKTHNNHVDIILMGDVTQEKLTSGGKLHLATLPAGTFNIYYETPIMISVTQYESNIGGVLAGYITKDGKVMCYAGTIPFTPSGSCQWNLSTTFYIQD